MKDGCKMKNSGKAVLFTIIVMAIATMMGIVCNVPNEVYMFAPMIAVAVMLLITGDASNERDCMKLDCIGLGSKSGHSRSSFPLLSCQLLIWYSGRLLMHR